MRQWVKVPAHDGCHRFGVDIAQVVVHQDVAKPADFAPRHIGVFGLQRVGQLLRGFRQGLQVAQSGVVQHLILGQVASGLNVSDALDGIQNVQGLSHRKRTT